MERRRVGRIAPADLDDIVYGIHAVTEALRGGEKLRRIHVADERRRDPALSGLLAAAHEAGTTVRFESRAFFAQDLEAKLNDPVFTPAGYAVTHLAFNSARAEYLLILEDERNDPRVREPTAKLLV